MVASMRISYCSTGMEKACLGTLVLQERRVLFPRACFALSIVNNGLGRAVVLPRLGARFCIEIVS